MRRNSLARLTIRLFGYPQLLLDNVPLKVERRKTIALAADLAVEAASNRNTLSHTYLDDARPLPTRPAAPLPTGCGRETLASLLWPDCSQDQAGAYLRQSLWGFSKAVGDDWIVKANQFICFNPAAEH